MSVEILVCIRCRPPGAPGDEPRAGPALYEAVQIAAFDVRPAFTIRPVECMSSCKRSCTVAFQSSNKITYLFGDLPADADSARDILTCAKNYHESSSGFMPRDSRPERMQAGILARIPVLQGLETNA